MTEDDQPKGVGCGGWGMMILTSPLVGAVAFVIGVLVGNDDVHVGWAVFFLFEAMLYGLIRWTQSWPD